VHRLRQVRRAVPRTWTVMMSPKNPEHPAQVLWLERVGSGRLEALREVLPWTPAASSGCRREPEALRRARRCLHVPRALVPRCLAHQVQSDMGCDCHIELFFRWVICKPHL